MALYHSQTQRHMINIFVSHQEKVDHGIEAEGSNLSGVNSKCSWEEPGEPDYDIYDDKENQFENERRGSNDRHISILG